MSARRMALLSALLVAACWDERWTEIDVSADPGVATAQSFGYCIWDPLTPDAGSFGAAALQTVAANACAWGADEVPIPGTIIVHHSNDGPDRNLRGFFQLTTHADAGAGAPRCMRCPPGLGPIDAVQQCVHTDVMNADILIVHEATVPHYSVHFARGRADGPTQTDGEDADLRLLDAGCAH